MNTRAKSSGFTLIELAIVVAVVAILAAVAFPTYKDQVRKSRRSEAIAELSQLALEQEKFRANNTQYFDTVANLCDWRDDGDTTNDSCTDNDLFDTDYYDVAVAAGANATTYTLTASPKAGTDQVNDKCDGDTYARLTLDQSNDKGAEDSSSNPVTGCW